MIYLVFLLVVGTAAEQLIHKPYYNLKDADKIFEKFSQEHGKLYDPEEYLHRLEIFKGSLMEINERNAMYPQSVFAVTRFADLTPEEIYGNTSRILSEEIGVPGIKLHLRPEEITAPDHWDWRDHGAVAHVKDQGKCASCWIFSATGAIEGQYAIKYNKNLAFSEQQSLDCVEIVENVQINNCEGGFPGAVMAYHEKFGVVLEKDYPYTGIQSTCREDPTKVVTKVTHHKVLTSTDEETLKQLVYEKGPLAVSIDPRDLTYHKKGIVYPHDCTDVTGHAVLLVGYGIENGTKYWILKDSYGLDRGDQGYFKLVRGINACCMGTQYTAYCTVA